MWTVTDAVDGVVGWGRPEDVVADVFVLKVGFRVAQFVRVDGQ